MRRQDKLKVIMEANQKLEKKYLKDKGLVNEVWAYDIKYFPQLKDTEIVSDNMIPEKYPKKGDKVNLKDGKSGEVEYVFKNNSNNQVMYGLVMFASPDGGGKYRNVVSLGDIKG